MSGHYQGIPIISTDAEAPQGLDGMGRGYDAASAKPAGFAAPLMNVVRIPRAHWSDRIKEQEAKHTSVEHWCQVGDVKITNQRSYGYCHNDQTEVLTDTGWKLFEHLRDSDLLGTVNPQTRAMEFQSPSARQVFDYDGKMLYNTNSRMPFGVTPNHRMYVRKWNERKRTLNDHYEFVTAEKLGWYSGAMAAPSGSNGVNVRRLNIEGDREYSGDDFVALVALVCSDGYAGNSEKSMGYVSFCCFDPSRRQMVADMARRLGFEEQPGREGVWTRYSAHALARWMWEHCYTGEPSAQTKKVPQFIKELSQRQLEVFFRYFGDQDHARPMSNFYSSSKRMVDDIQELLLRIGKRASIGEREPRTAVMKNGHVIRSGKSYSAHVYTTDKLSIERKKQIETESYRGPVYCATVPNGTLVTRMNNSVLISGNCWCYGTVGAIMARYAMEGRTAPHLNPFYPAYLGKGGRNQGGWAGEALEYIDKYGIPEWGVFTDQPTSRNAFERAEVKASAEKHKVASFLELPRNDVEALISVLLADYPLPVTLGLSWWGHLVYATRVLETSPGVFGILFRNSWDYSYGDNGRGILTLNKAVAFEQIAIDLNVTVAA